MPLLLQHPGATKAIDPAPGDSDIHRAPRLVLEGERDLAAVARRQVGGDQDFQRLEAFTAIDGRLRITAEGVDDVAVIQRVPKTVNRGRFVVGLLDIFVVVTLVLEVPDLDVVHCNAADPDSALLAEDGDGAFQVLGIGEHGAAHGAKGTAAPADV